MTKIKNSILILISIFLINCKDNIKREFFNDGNLKVKYYVNSKNQIDGEYIEYFNNGNVKSKHTFLEGKKVGTSFYYYNKKEKLAKTIVYHDDSISMQKTYYKNGKLMSQGKIYNDSIRIDNWSFNDSLGNKTDAIEYFKIGQKSYPNQRWIFDEKGDTIGGNYYKFSMKDTIFKDESLRAYFVLSRYAISKDSKLYLCIPKLGYSLENDFSNEKLIKWDTILNMESLLKNNPKYKGWNHDVIFDLEVSKIGDKRLRGFLLEEEYVKSDSINFMLHKIYFDLPFYVKEKDTKTED